MEGNILKIMLCVFDNILEDMQNPSHTSYTLFSNGFWSEWLHSRGKYCGEICNDISEKIANCFTSFPDKFTSKLEKLWIFGDKIQSLYMCFINTLDFGLKNTFYVWKT